MRSFADKKTGQQKLNDILSGKFGEQMVFHQQN